MHRVVSLEYAIVLGNSRAIESDAHDAFLSDIQVGVDAELALQFGEIARQLQNVLIERWSRSGGDEPVAADDWHLRGREDGDNSRGHPIVENSVGIVL